MVVTLLTSPWLSKAPHIFRVIHMQHLQQCEGCSVQPRVGTELKASTLSTYNKNKNNKKWWMIAEVNHFTHVAQTWSLQQNSLFTSAYHWQKWRGINLAWRRILHELCGVLCFFLIKVCKQVVHFYVPFMWVYFDYLPVVFISVIVLMITSGFQAGSYIYELSLLVMQMQRKRLLNLSSSLYLNYSSPKHFDASCLTRYKSKTSSPLSLHTLK